MGFEIILHSVDFAPLAHNWANHQVGSCQALPRALQLSLTQYQWNSPLLP